MTAPPEMDELCQHVLQDSHVFRRAFAAGAKLLPDRSADSFQVVVQGALAIQCHRRNGGAITLEVLGVGGCLPSGVCASPIGERIVFLALVPTTVARVPQSTLARIVLKTPSLANALGAKLAEQHVELLVRQAALSERARSRRFAGGLLYVAQKLNQQCPLAAGMRVPLTQFALAQIADVSRQTANEVLRRLESWGIVRIERSVVCVLDCAALEAFAEGRVTARVWMPVGPCKLEHPKAPLTCYPLRRAVRPNS
jgi:CRP-like cAMP-binding protein